MLKRGWPCSILLPPGSGLAWHRMSCFLRRWWLWKGKRKTAASGGFSRQQVRPDGRGGFSLSVDYRTTRNIYSAHAFGLSSGLITPARYRTTPLGRIFQANCLRSGDSANGERYLTDIFAKPSVSFCCVYFTYQVLVVEENRRRKSSQEMCCIVGCCAVCAMKRDGRAWELRAHHLRCAMRKNTFGDRYYFTLGSESREKNMIVLYYYGGP